MLTALLALSRPVLACSCGGLPEVFPADGAVVPDTVVPLLGFPSGADPTPLTSNGEEVPVDIVDRREGDVVLRTLVPLAPLVAGQEYELAGHTFLVGSNAEVPPSIPDLRDARGHRGIQDHDCWQEPYLYFRLAAGSGDPAWFEVEVADSDTFDGAAIFTLPTGTTTVSGGGLCGGANDPGLDDAPVWVRARAVSPSGTQRSDWTAGREVHFEGLGCTTGEALPVGALPLVLLIPAMRRRRACPGDH
jgi:hypothetical protein